MILSRLQKINHTSNIHRPTIVRYKNAPILLKIVDKWWRILPRVEVSAETGVDKGILKAFCGVWVKAIMDE
jgi:hypothetical protein